MTKRRLSMITAGIIILLGFVICCQATKLILYAIGCGIAGISVPVLAAVVVDYQNEMFGYERYSLWDFIVNLVIGIFITGPFIGFFIYAWGTSLK